MSRTARLNKALTAAQFRRYDRGETNTHTRTRTDTHRQTRSSQYSAPLSGISYRIVSQTSKTCLQSCSWTNLASGSSSSPKNTSVTSTRSHCRQTEGHISPHIPIHGCPHGSRLGHGWSQRGRSQTSWHSRLQRKWWQTQRHGSRHGSHGLPQSRGHRL